MNKYINYKNKKMTDENPFKLHVRDPWLFYIQTGIKSVEGRKGDKNKYKDWIGKKVIFFNEDRSIPVIVNAIRHYNDLYEYLNKEEFKKVLPDKNIKSFRDAVDAYHQFYSDEQIKQSGGMLAIEISLI